MTWHLGERSRVLDSVCVTWHVDDIVGYGSAGRESGFAAAEHRAWCGQSSTASDLAQVVPGVTASAPPASVRT
ncbi:hypothetical protein A5650_04745 [Mycobacterium sp. 1164985.4]|nr:hypothetical protein A5650_04745 [Mycobacterium sp. 1164985.4]